MSWSYSEDENGYACPECVPLGTARRKAFKGTRELWLAFVIHELHGLKWDGKGWA